MPLQRLLEARRQETKKPPIKLPPIEDVFSPYELGSLRTVGFKRGERYDITFNPQNYSPKQKEAFQKKYYPGLKEQDYGGLVGLSGVAIPQPVHSRSQVDELIDAYNRYTKTGSRFPEPKTWVTRKRDFMKKRYTSTPMAGFSGVLGGGSTRKKLLGT